MHLIPVIYNRKRKEIRRLHLSTVRCLFIVQHFVQNCQRLKLVFPLRKSVKYGDITVKIAQSLKLSFIKEEM